tara:strand:- start:52 stop:774 length:723 start_codon:yes stop_codon:yes gene_type:complete
MKTAICFTGTCRSLQHTHKNIKERLIDPFNECDVFMLVAKNPDSEKANIYFGDLPQLKVLLIEDEPEHDVSEFDFKPNWPSGKLSSKQVYIKMIESRKRCGEVLSLYEEKNNVAYDRIIFSRLDVKYFNNVSKIIADLPLSNLYVPDFHNSFGGVINGYNDRFAVSNRKNMKTYFKIPDSIVDFQRAGGKIHAETLLKWHLIKNEVLVEHAPVRFTRVRPSGKEMDLRIESEINWSLGDT